MRRRECLLPTWQGWLLLLAVLFALGWLAVHHVHSFLATTDPVSGGVLVVEGWTSDYTLQAAVDEFKRDDYAAVYVVGGPIERGAPLSSYKTFAELGRAILIKQGLPEDKCVAVPAPLVPQDRTYTGFRVLKEYLEKTGELPASMHLVSEGVHARRSRLMLKLVTGDEVRVGVTSVPSQNYDAKRWWGTSSGFKAVLNESLSWFYARALFHP